MGLCDIQNRNSNKKTRKKNKKTKCIRHTTPFLTDTRKSGKQVKIDKNSSPAGRLWYTLRKRPRQRHDSPSAEKNKQSNVHAYFPFLLPLHVLFSVHWLERTRHHPVSVMISSHSVSLHDFILNKTSYATEYFVCPHQLRFHNSLSNSPTSYFMPMGGRRIAICKATSNVNYPSY